MISLGALAIVVAVIIYVVVGIWYGVTQPDQVNQVALWLFAAATFLLIIGLVVGSYSLMMYGAGAPHSHHLLSCIKGLNTPMNIGDADKALLGGGSLSEHGGSALL